MHFDDLAILIIGGFFFFLGWLVCWNIFTTLACNYRIQHYLMSIVPVSHNLSTATECCNSRHSLYTRVLDELQRGYEKPHCKSSIRHMEQADLMQQEPSKDTVEMQRVCIIYTYPQEKTNVIYAE